MTWQTCVGEFLQWQTKGICRTVWGTELQSNKIYKEGSAWVFEQPLIASNDSKPHMKADKLIINFAFHPFDLTVDLNVRLINPTFHLDEKEDEKELLAFIIPFYRSNLSVDIEHANVSWSNFKANFNMKLRASRNNQEAILVGEFVEPNAAPFDLYFDRNYDKTHINTTLNNIECEAIYQLARTFGISLSGWKSNHGQINGDFALTFIDNTLTDISANGSVRELDFSQRKSGISGNIEEAVFNLSSSPDDIKQYPFIPCSKAKIQLTKKSFLRISQDDLPEWEIDNLIGEIGYSNNNSATLIFKGDCDNKGHSFNLQIDGRANLKQDQNSSADLALSLKNSREEKAIAHFHIKQLDSENNSAQVELSKIGPLEFSLLKALLRPHFPVWKQLYWHSGNITAQGTAKFQGLQVTDVVLNYVAAQDLAFLLEPWDISAQVGSMVGNFSAKFQPELVWESINSKFGVQRGKITLKGLQNHLWTFSDISTDIAIQDGVVQKSLLKGVTAGLQGIVELDWLAKETVMRIHLSGDTKEIARISPAEFKEGIENKFADDILKLEAQVHRKGSGAKIGGILQIFSEKTKTEEKIVFGFDLARSTELYLQEWQAYNLELDHLENSGQAALHTIWPAISSQLDALQSNWMKKSMGIAGYHLRNGWFHADDLPSEKYLSPFLFAGLDMQLQGIGNFKGNFDQVQLDIAYSGRNVILENSDFSIIAKQIGSKEHLSASHHFDFEKGSHLGTIPLHNSTYHDKCSNLLFSGLDSLVVLEGKKAHFTETETFCEGVFLCGNIDVDFSDPRPDAYDIDIHMNTINGKISQVRQIFSHFEDPSFLMNIPLEGTLFSRGRGGCMKMHLAPDEYDVIANMQGTIVDGSMNSTDLNLALDDLCCDFDYDQETSKFDLSNLHANLVIGKAENIEEYSLVGDYINFTDYIYKEAKFDVWVANTQHDILRLVGRSITHNKDSVDQLLEIELDPLLTHIGDVHPKIFTLVLKKDDSVKQFDLELDFQLLNFLQNLQIVLRSGVMPFEQNVQDGLKALKNAKGNFQAAMHFNDESGSLEYQIQGSDVSVGDYNFDRCLLNGKRKNQTWTIDQLLLDDLSLAADLGWIQDEWKVKFLGIRYKEAFLVGLEGKLLDNLQSLRGRVNLLEIDLSKLPDNDVFRPFISEFKPKGKLRGEGTFSVTLEHQRKLKCHVESELKLKLHNWELRGLHFKDTDNISCRITPEGGLTLTDIKTALVQNNSQDAQAAVNINEVRYSFSSDELLLNQLEFKVPLAKLRAVADNLQIAFPHVVTAETSELLSKIKNEGSIEGSLDFELTSPYSAVRINLKDGRYNLWGTSHHLKNCIIEYNPLGLQLTSQYIWEDTPIWIRAQSNAHSFNNGQIILSEMHPDIDEPSTQMLIKWENDPLWGFIIRDAKGSLHGIDVQLTLDHNTPMSIETVYLVGTMNIDASKTIKLLPIEFRDAISSWKVGKGYTLTGTWKWHKLTSSSLARKFNFSGNVSGKDFHFKGYQFKNLTGQLTTTHNSFLFKDLILEDPAISLRTNEIILSKDIANNWEIEMPSLIVSKLRPSILLTVGERELINPRPLIIQNLVFHDVSGALNDLKTLKGKGSFYFSNRSRKLLQNTIFQIPVEILSRIGLDLAVLTPITGNVEFTIDDGKIILDHFKDIYSEGKLSKFYLPNNNYISYVDFDGNLHMQVKMKQYNLVFKLAELFTVSIQGSLNKPTYSLQRQSVKEWQKLLPIPFRKSEKFER